MIYPKCQRAGCPITVESGKKYCSREHSPYGHLLGDAFDPESSTTSQEMSLRIQSAKAKGRRLAQECKEDILAHFSGLQDDDIQITGSGATGEDLLFSPLLQDLFPVIAECKNQERFSIWCAYAQAEKHAARALSKKNKSLFPIVFFRRNHSPRLATLRLDHLLKLLTDHRVTAQEIKSALIQGGASLE